MGLDAYLFAEKVEAFGHDENDFQLSLTRSKQVAYWRKDYKLHHEMFVISQMKDEHAFNMERVYLTSDQVHKFIMSGYDEFTIAKEWQERGYKIYYDSWW